MGWALHLKRLARIVPGVAGHQDRDAIRESDRLVRLELASELYDCSREIEKVKRRLIERKERAALPGLDYLSAKIDKLSNLIRYAGQGYSGYFDPSPIGREQLVQLLAFDQELFDETASIKARVNALEGGAGEEAALNRRMQEVDGALDQLEKVFSTRCNLLTAQ